jgi:hypothetical protein
MSRIEISQVTGWGRREVVADAPTFEDAEQLARERWEVLAFELDADYSDCADFFTASGEVFAIQPQGFRL